MAAHENPALAGERRGAVFQDGDRPTECHKSHANATDFAANPVRLTIETLHWEVLCECADVVWQLGDCLSVAAENRSLASMRAGIVCLRDTAKTAIAAFNEIGGAL